jgi:hypothetical protein
MEQYLIFLLFGLVGISLLFASISDYKNRKVPIKFWYPAVFIALPLSMLVLGKDIWDGVINVTYPYYSVPIAFSIIIICVFGLIAHSEKYIKMGGADYIAIVTIIIVLSSINLYLSPYFFIMFFGYAIVTLITYYLFGLLTKDYKIPFIITISMAYITTIGLFLVQTNFGTLPLV